MPEEQEMGERHEPESRALRGYRLGSVWGVPIAVDWSLLVIFALVTFDLGAGVFPSWHPSWSPVVVWTTAFCAAVLFFGSLLLHELSHALMARGFGIRVRGITLFLFGGVTQLAREAGAPKTEFFVAIVGPLTSLVLGGTAWVIGMRTAGPALGEAIANGDANALSSALRDAGPLTTLLLWLGPINVTLAVFNLVPGFPLDGGRVFRALLWAITRDLERATRWASLAGQAVAHGLIAGGVYAMVSGAFGSGLWLMLIGWFLNESARRSRADVRAPDGARQRPVTAGRPS